MQIPIKTFDEFNQNDYLTPEDQENVGYVKSDYLRISLFEIGLGSCENFLNLSQLFPKANMHELDQLENYITTNDSQQTFEQHKKNIFFILQNLNKVVMQVTSFSLNYLDELEKSFFYIKMLQHKLEIELKNLNQFIKQISGIPEYIVNKTNTDIKKYLSKVLFRDVFPFLFMLISSQYPPIKYSQANDFLNRLSKDVPNCTQEQFSIIARNLFQLDQNVFELLNNLDSVQKAFYVLLACDKYNIYEYGIFNPNNRIRKLIKDKISSMDIWLLSNGISGETKKEIINKYSQSYNQVNQNLEDEKQKLKDFGMAIFPKARKKKSELISKIEKTKAELIKNPIFTLQHSNDLKDMTPTQQKNLESFIRLQKYALCQNSILQFVNCNCFYHFIENNPYFLAVLETLIYPNKAKNFIKEIYNQTVKNKYLDLIQQNATSLIFDSKPFLIDNSVDLLPFLQKVIESNLSPQEKQDYLQFLKNVTEFPDNSPERLATIQFFKIQAKINSPLKPLEQQSENLDKAIEKQYCNEIPPMSPEHQQKIICYE